jgi:hypothetical protein
MAWFGVGSGSRRAKPERAQRFEQADGVVVEAFADMHEARHLRSKFRPVVVKGQTGEAIVRSLAHFITRDVR